MIILLFAVIHWAAVMEVQVLPVSMPITLTEVIFTMRFFMQKINVNFIERPTVLVELREGCLMVRKLLYVGW